MVMMMTMMVRMTMAGKMVRRKCFTLQKHVLVKAKTGGLGRGQRLSVRLKFLSSGSSSHRVPVGVTAQMVFSQKRIILVVALLEHIHA